MFKNEREFSKFFTKYLKSKGIDTMRLESGTTVTGCPDMWIQCAGDDYWIELKNIPIADTKLPVTVPWRPGQQAWFKLYAMHHSMSHKFIDGRKGIRIKYGWTVAAIGDMLWFIRMDKTFKDNCIVRDNVHCIHKDMLHETNIINFLAKKSYEYIYYKGTK